MGRGRFQCRCGWELGVGDGLIHIVLSEILIELYFSPIKFI